MPSADEVSRAAQAAADRSARDTIAAVATQPGRGGIGIVRLSGPAVARIARAVLGELPPPRLGHLWRFNDSHGEPVDEWLALFFPAPNSYTGEDVLELHGHGGPVVMELVLQRCLTPGRELGLGVADPGGYS